MDETEEKLTIEQLHKAGEDGDAEAQFQLGEYYRHEGNDEQGVLWYQKAAQQGHAGAQYELGHCFQFSIGVESNMTQAIYWYRKAADQGLLYALEALVYCYARKDLEQDQMKAYEMIEAIIEQGQCDSLRIGQMYDWDLRDDKNAAYWYQKAAEQGDTEAQMELGKCYYNGKGISQDIEKALLWYEKSATSDPHCAWTLADMYFQGENIEQDKKIALIWYEFAANKYAEYAWQLGEMYYYGRNEAEESEDVEEENFEKNYEKAEKWYICAAERWWMYAAWLADKYLEEDELKNQEKSYIWLKRAGKMLLADELWMKANDAIAKRVLGDYYFSIEQNYEKAVKYYLLATKAKNLRYYLMSGEEKHEFLLRRDYRIGLCYYHGWGVAQDFDLAADWFVKATSYSCMGSLKCKDLFPILRTLAEEENNAAAQYGLGLTYERGNGIEKNDKLAVEWYQKAAENGDLDAIFEMGERYLYGDGVTEDNKTASRLFLKAAEQGYIPAIELLEKNGRDVSGYQRLHGRKVRMYRVHYDRSK